MHPTGKDGADPCGQSTAAAVTRQVLQLWLNSEEYRSANDEPWLTIVDRAIMNYHHRFDSAQDSSSATFTHDGIDENGEPLPPWSPQREMDVAVAISTSRTNHRWPVRGAQSVGAVERQVSFDRHCDLNYRGCTAVSHPSKSNIVTFSAGSLIVLCHVCAECWQRWIDRDLEPPVEMIYEADIEPDLE